MVVRAVKNTKKLVKGCLYQLDHIYGTTSKMVIISGLGYFESNLFTLEDGSEIPNKEWSSESYKTYQSTLIRGEDIKIGDILIYQYGSSKYLVVGKKYKVVDIKPTYMSSGTYYKLKVDGLNTWVGYNCFRKCTQQELREISLTGLLDNTVVNTTVDTQTRKIDQIPEDEKNRIIFKLLCSAIVDTNRNNMSIVDWAVSKSGTQWELTRKDFNKYLSKSMSEIIREFESNDIITCIT